MKRRGYSDGIVRYPTSVIDHKETAKDPLQDDVNALKDFRSEQETAIPNNVIKGIREMENFLSGTTDAKTLQQLFSMFSATTRAYIASVINTMQMDEESGDITIQYDNGETDNND